MPTKIEKLREALAPFAAMADELANEPAWKGVLEHDHPLAGRVSVADFRRAADTLSQPEAAGGGVRPSDCRNALRDAGKPYPRSGCAVCKDGGLRGCPYERRTLSTPQNTPRVSEDPTPPDTDIPRVYEDAVAEDGGEPKVGPLHGKYGDVLRPAIPVGRPYRNWRAIRSPSSPSIREYGADVANMAMMLVDVCGALPDNPAPLSDEAAKLRAEVERLRADRARLSDLYGDAYVELREAKARLAQAERAGVTDDAVRQAGDILKQHGLNAPEQVIYQAARAALKAALQPQEQGR